MNDLLANAPCGFVTIDDDGMITQANMTFASMLGYSSAKELAGVPFDKILPVASRIFYQTHLFPLLKLRGSVSEIYLTIRTKAGSDLPTLMNAVRHERRGDLAIDCVFVQMKERSEYEEAILRAKKAAEDAIHTKDQFLGTVSHELRTPLHSMIGWLRLMEAKRSDPEIADKGLKAIDNGLQSLRTMIEDLIDFSRANSGRFRLSREKVDVRTVVESALETVQPAIDAKSIRVLTNFDRKETPVSGDPGRLQQVLWNILSNAIKFTPKAGEVEVRLGRVNSSVEVSVRDTGKGISSSFLPYVFDRFQQEHGDAGGRGGGLGIGMAITRQLVELHGGSIRAESDGEGKGATFIVRLPVMVVNRAEPIRVPSLLELDQGVATLEQVDVRLEGLKVLILEDDATARSMLTSLLEKAGAGVFASGTLADGLEYFRTVKPDAVVCDIELPDGDGYSFIRSVRAIEGAQSAFTPAIALTALARPDDRVKALKAGFHTYFTKPIEPVELVLAIGNLTNTLGRPF